jgi:hypothetical protein
MKRCFHIYILELWHVNNPHQTDLQIHILAEVLFLHLGRNQLGQPNYERFVCSHIFYWK